MWFKNNDLQALSLAAIAGGLIGEKIYVNKKGEFPRPFIPIN